ncbi:S-adenosyl-L-methionine-dependent methyltransferase [Jimgerdemannia flammicorona]|uniref:type II protein arginine methyltransferase n=1 Tax=Jimgerdemannia flammicorona TaxID=994334 RepID=A0A433D808_9FUNG|nr:S-adenosyl-L-methionine-dependent methyltransferase [Jimgerdemannia flammicorona]
MGRPTSFPAQIRLLASSSVTKKHLPIGWHAYSTLSENSPKIYALPFKLNQDKARSLIDMTASVHKRPFWSAFRMLGSAITGQALRPTDRAENLTFRPAYIPFWYYDLAASCTTTMPLPRNAPDDAEPASFTEPLLGIGLNCFWPGHSWAPLTYLSFGLPHGFDEGELVPFNPNVLLDDVEPEILPFTESPLAAIVDRFRAIPSSSLRLMEPRLSIDPRSIRVEFAAAYPLYWPVYIAEFDAPSRAIKRIERDGGGVEEGEEEETRKTIVLGAHNEDPWICQWEPRQTGIRQWMNNGAWVTMDVTDPMWKLLPFHNTMLKQFEQRFVDDFLGRYPFDEEEEVEEASEEGPKVAVTAAVKAIDWPDKRIMTYPHHQRANKAYVEAMFSWRIKEGMLHSMMKMRDDTPAFGFGRKTEVKNVGDMKAELRRDIKVAKEEFEEKRPAWVEVGQNEGEEEDATYLFVVRSSIVPLAKRNSQSFLPVLPSRTLSTTQRRLAGPFIPFFSQPEEDPNPEHKTYPRVTAQDIAAAKNPAPPTRANMLVRDFIDDSLYNPKYGYFSRQAVIFSPEHDFDFTTMRDHLHFIKILGKKYAEVEQDFDDTDKVARQVWHTPTELFKVLRMDPQHQNPTDRPYYGYAIAKYMVTEYKLNLFPNRDLIVYEMGAGNGTLMFNILDYIQEYEPAVYKRTRYRIIEISDRLAERQADKQKVREAKDRHRCIEIVNKSIFEWDQVEPDHCFFLAMEVIVSSICLGLEVFSVIDNFAHDLIRYDTDTLQPYQALVSTDGDGDYKELYEPVGRDPLISRYLHLRRQTPYRTPVLQHQLLRKLRSNLLPFASSMTRAEFIPTKLLLFLEILHTRFPQHRLVVSDFHELPDNIDGVDAPVVQTRYRGTMVPCSTYMVQPGYFDIFFPTNFELLRDMYQLVCRSRRPSGEKSVRVVGHREFLERYGDLDRTRTRSGENPMLMYYENVKMLLT